MTGMDDDLRAARGIAIALPLGLLLWGLLIIGILWWVHQPSEFDMMIARITAGAEE